MFRNNNKIHMPNMQYVTRAIIPPDGVELEEDRGSYF